MKSLTDQFISDYYQSLLHIDGISLSTTLTYVYDGGGNKTGIGLSGENVVIDNLLLKKDSEYLTLIDYLHPVNSVLLTIDDVNPQTRFTNTKWERIASGRFLAGVGTGNDSKESYTISVGNGSGTYSHKLSISEIPSHDHLLPNFRFVADRDNDENKSVWIGTDNPVTRTAKTGGDQSHNNRPPEFGVYVWKRTQ
jgi:hypothetical protein